MAAAEFLDIVTHIPDLAGIDQTIDGFLINLPEIHFIPPLENAGLYIFGVSIS